MAGATPPPPPVVAVQRPSFYGSLAQVFEHRATPLFSWRVTLATTAFLTSLNLDWAEMEVGMGSLKKEMEMGHALMRKEIKELKIGQAAIRKELETGLSLLRRDMESNQQILQRLSEGIETRVRYMEKADDARTKLVRHLVAQAQPKGK